MNLSRSEYDLESHDLQAHVDCHFEMCQLGVSFARGRGPTGKVCFHVLQGLLNILHSELLAPGTELLICLQACNYELP